MKRCAKIFLPLLLGLPLHAPSPALLAAESADMAKDPRAYCMRVVNDDETRKPPVSLVAAIKRLYDLTGNDVADTTYIRCAGGKVLVCYVGANLSCAKPDRRRVLAPADQWCRQNPNSDFIPMVVTGHDTAWVWRCVGGKAKPGKANGPFDARGFFADQWKALP